MPQVNIPGIGTVNFPDNMKPEDIQKAIETEILPQSQAQKEPVAKPSVFDAFKDPSSDLGKQNAQYRAHDEGVVEGAFRALEGPGQLVSAGVQAVGDLYDKFRSSKISELVTGKKPSLQTLKNYNEAVQGRREQARRDFEAEYNTPYPETLAKVSEVLTGFLGTSELKAAEGVTGFWGAIREGAKTGGVLAPTSFAEQADVNDKIHQSLLGALFGGAVGAVTGGLQAAKNSFAKLLTSRPVQEQAAAAKTLEDPNGMFPSLEGQLSIGQRTGNVRTQQLESKVGGRELQESLLNQAKAVRGDLEAAANKYGPDLSAREIADKGGIALQSQIEKLRTIRDAIFKSDLGVIRTKLATDAGIPIEEGGKVLVQIPGLKQRLADLLEERGVEAQSLSPAIKSYLEKYAQNGGSLAFDDLSKLLVRLNDRNFTIANAAGNPEQVAGLAAGIRKAVNSSLDDIAESSEVGKLLQEARSGYGAAKERIAGIKNSSLAEALGINAKSGHFNPVENPEQALQKILSLGPTQQKEVGSLLKLGDPDTLAALRGHNLRTALQDATEVTSPGMPNLNVEKLVKATAGDGKLRAAGLYSPQDAEVLRKNLDSLRVLLSKADFKSPVAEPEGIAMSAVGLLKGAASAPFAARIISRLTGAGGLEKVLFDPKTQKEFLTISQGFGAKSVAAMRAASQASARLESVLDSDTTNEDK